MPHRSDSNYKLHIEKFEALTIYQDEDCVIFYNVGYRLPINKRLHATEVTQRTKKQIESLGAESVVCVLCDNRTALELIPEFKNLLHFRLWVAIRREQPIPREGNLSDDHAALLIFTKNKKTFRHSKLQIEYTICPACDKTTKDYGGKKHLYSPYGTLISDVWRDIKIGGNYDVILERVVDLFSVEPFKELHHYDLSEEFQLKEIKNKRSKVSTREGNLASALINEDCISALRGIPQSSIDFAFADPPYNINKKYDTWDDAIDIEEYFEWCDSWIDEIFRVLKPGSVFCIINIPLWVARHYLHAKKKFNFLDYICWEGLSLPVRNIMPAHYGLLCFSKGKPNAIANHDTTLTPETLKNSAMTQKEWYCVRQSCVKKRNTPHIVDREPLTNIWWDIHRLKHNSRRVDHPCQLPPDLMKRLIHTYTNEGDCVLDPFNGAGTTSLVADLMNRNYIGIELSEKYHLIAQYRHREIGEGLDPFRKVERKMTAKNSRVARLKKQKYSVSKKTLQLEVREIAKRLGRKPTKDDITKFSKHPLEYFENYFIDWGEVCAAVGDKGMSEDIKPKTNQEMLKF